jgi:hypothetical protein
VSGFSVDPADLAAAARGIETVIGELSSLGIDALAGGQQGRGFDQLSLTGMQLGSASLRDVLDDYCNRWQWGVRALVQDAQAIAQALDLAAGTNLAVDQHVMESLKVLGASAFADPRAGEQEVMDASWRDLASGATSSDYSVESFASAYDESKETWTAVGSNVAENPPGVAGLPHSLRDPHRLRDMVAGD